MCSKTNEFLQALCNDACLWQISNPRCWLYNRRLCNHDNQILPLLFVSLYRNLLFVLCEVAFLGWHVSLFCPSLVFIWAGMCDLPVVPGKLVCRPQKDNFDRWIMIITNTGMQTLGMHFVMFWTWFNYLTHLFDPPLPISSVY